MTYLSLSLIFLLPWCHQQCLSILLRLLRTWDFNSELLAAMLDFNYLSFEKSFDCVNLISRSFSSISSFVVYHKNDTRLAEVWWTDSDKMLRRETARRRCKGGWVVHPPVQQWLVILFFFVNEKSGLFIVWHILMESFLRWTMRCTSTITFALHLEPGVDNNRLNSMIE